ncbi:MAG: alpha/beta fold hydrolase [Hyphomicrobiaceae bacterium]
MRDATDFEQLSLPDGRRLGWTTFGDPGGRPVLAFHGTPACRLLFSPADDVARRLGLCVIAPDRPGFGVSDPQPGRTLADWSRDTSHLMDHLRIGRAPVVAISGGGPYAVGVAAHLSERISGLALVSPLGEIGAPSDKVHLSRAERGFFLGLPKVPRLLRRGARMTRAAFLAAPEVSFSMFAATLSSADRRVFSVPATRRAMIAMTREAVRQGVDAPLADMAIFSKPWGLDLGAIRTPAVLWQGTADKVVPAAFTFDFADRLGDCRVHELEGQGHFWVFEHIEEVMRAVADLPFRE